MKPVVPANVPASPKTLFTSCAKAALDSAAASNNELTRVQYMMLNRLAHRANAVHRESACKADPHLAVPGPSRRECARGRLRALQGREPAGRSACWGECLSQGAITP